MGEQRVSLLQDKSQMQRFVKALLGDVQALEYMITHEWFEGDVTRIGAEQEMVLVQKKNLKPATIAMEALARMTQYDWVGTELAKFNLETNLTPRVFHGTCLSDLENENSERIALINEVVREMGAEVVLTGILPTLRKFDMGMHNLTPLDRYKALMEAINEQLIGSAYELRLVGIDELLLKHDTPFIEACNTSFQVHLQVTQHNFVQLYNIAQTLAAPVMAIAANSPLVFGRRLWHESRIALFQQALDTRTSSEHMRQRSPRVSFGNDWLKKSILEIYREDIARFRVLLSSNLEEDALAAVREGRVPKLRALQVHNSTVYRWNRPCYGISENGRPHLRIENRVLPSGPTVVDEVANAAFWLGAMVSFGDHYPDITEHISFDDVSDNFGKAARFGIDSKFTWMKDKKISAIELVINELIPMAREGLAKQKIVQEDIDKYMGIIEARAKEHMNGARWTLRAYSKLKKEATEDEALAVVTSAMLKNQSENLPVHLWAMPELSDLESYEPGNLKVSEFMATDLFTVQPDDIVEFVAEMMDWRKIRYTPVEDRKGKLVGLVTIRLLLRHCIRQQKAVEPGNVCVQDIMISKPLTIDPDVSIKEAMHIMRSNKIGCLPVVKEGELIGVITEMDFLRITGRLFDRLKE